MNRLTILIDNGLDEICFEVPNDREGLYNIVDVAELLENDERDEILFRIAKRLKAYEDTGLEPHHIDDIVGQLLGYLDAEQAGLLIELPCKVGDTVYYVNLSNKVINYTVSGFKVDCFGNLQINVARHLESGYFLDMQLGKTVFLTREEAEKALEEAK